MAQVGKSFVEYANHERQPLNYVMRPWARLGGLIMLVAPRGAGKTFLAQAIALAAAYGRTFGPWKPDFPMNVAYLDGEMGHDANCERLSMLTDLSDEPSGAFRICTFEDFGGLVLNLASRSSEQIWNKITEPYDFLIIDNLATCVRSTGRESEVELWARVQANAIRQREAGKTVLFIHHAGKSGEQRGTSTREDCLDTVISLVPSRFKSDDPTVTSLEWHFKKSRHFYGDDAKPLHIDMRTIGGKISFEFEALSAVFARQIVKWKNLGLRDSEISQILGVSIGEMKKHERSREVESECKSVDVNTAQNEEFPF